MEKPLLVVKVGTSAITRQDGSPDLPTMVEIARQMAVLHQSYRLVLVSSGAVGTGKRLLDSYTGKLEERKAAAAIGNPILLNTYATYFAPYGISIAQSLCERHHFSSRQQFLQLRSTFETLWEHGIIPIANENDVVSNFEICFSDNDELATLIAVGFDAKALLLGTSVDYVLDKENQPVKQIDDFTPEVMGWATKETSGLGLGGMISKLTFARQASRLGIDVVIFGVKGENKILEAAEGRTGTICPGKPSQLSARKKWLASGSLVSGKVEVDQGAFEALTQRKSLLAVGVKRIPGSFEKGEVIEIAIEGQPSFAVARTRISSQTLGQSLQKRDTLIAHADDIVFL